MSALNLEIYPQVIVIQTAIFAVNIWIVKNLFVKPYQRLIDKRCNLTLGDKSKAEHLLDEYEKKKSIYTKKFDETLLAAKAERELIKKESFEQQKKVLDEARNHSGKTLEEMKQKIAGWVLEEQKKIPGVVASLREQIYHTIIR